MEELVTFSIRNPAPACIAMSAHDSSSFRIIPKCTKLFQSPLHVYLKSWLRPSFGLMLFGVYYRQT